MSESSPSNETYGGGILVVVEGDAAIPGVSGPIVPDNPRLLDSVRIHALAKSLGVEKARVVGHDRPRNARNGSITFHHDQYPATVSFIWWATLAHPSRYQPKRLPQLQRL